MRISDWSSDVCSSDLFFEAQDLFDFKVVEVAVVDCEQGHAKFPDLQRLVLRLLEQFDHALAAFQLTAGSVVKVGGELSESGELTVLGQVGTNTAGHLLDDLGLRSAADTRHRTTGVDGGTNAGVEHVSFPADLTCGNGKDLVAHERGQVND